jgi:hypothetical protein
LSKETTCLSFLVSMCSLYRNRLTVLAGCADIMVSIVQAFPATIVALRIAQTPTCTLSVMSHVNVKSSAASGGATLAAPAPAVAPGGRHQMGIQNMNSPRSFNLMNPAEATVLYKSPRMTGSSVSSIGGGGERFCYERSAEVEQPNGSVSIAWAGLKLMLRVVMRMITFHQPGCVPGQPHHSQARSMETTLFCACHEHTQIFPSRTTGTFLNYNSRSGNNVNISLTRIIQCNGQFDSQPEVVITST